MEESVTCTYAEPLSLEAMNAALLDAARAVLRKPSAWNLAVLDNAVEDLARGVEVPS